MVALLASSASLPSSSGLLAWQWQGYSRYHQSRVNLLMHIVLVPLFLAGNLALIVGVIRLAWIEAATGALLMVLSIALQGRGHRGEAVPPVPFMARRTQLPESFSSSGSIFRASS